MNLSKNLLVGTGLDVTGTTQVNNIQPKSTDAYDSGTSLRRWKTVRAKTIIADQIEGVLNGNINGNANTATNLKNVTTFRLAGDVVSPSVQFDGQIGSYNKILKWLSQFRNTNECLTTILNFVKIERHDMIRKCVNESIEDYMCLKTSLAEYYKHMIVQNTKFNYASF
jgi:hypothetical protein